MDEEQVTDEVEQHDDDEGPSEQEKAAEDLARKKDSFMRSLDIGGAGDPHLEGAANRIWNRWVALERIRANAAREAAPSDPADAD